MLLACGHGIDGRHATFHATVRRGTPGWFLSWFSGSKFPHDLRGLMFAPADRLFRQLQPVGMLSC